MVGGYLRTIQGFHCATFKEATERLGLLEEDNNIRECLAEARNFKMPSALRRLFATILLYCEPTGVRTLWDENCAAMFEDYGSSSTSSTTFLTNRLLCELNNIFEQYNKSTKDFDLPRLGEGFQFSVDLPGLIENELSIPISAVDLNLPALLNHGQLMAYNTITTNIRQGNGAVFFVDGPGGTGKTFLYRCILATLRNEGRIVIATATSGIAANLLPDGNTAHSKFKIPIKLDNTKMCSFSKQSDMRKLVELASAIIWDEAPMENRKTFEILDRTLRDVLKIDKPFGDKVIILGGDFRQVMPIVVNGSRSEIIRASIIESYLWQDVKLLKLSDNMRARDDIQYAEFLLRVGDGEEHTLDNDMIQIIDSIVMTWEGNHSIDRLINFVFPDMQAYDVNTFDGEYMEARALITPLNEDVAKLNEKCLHLFTGDITTYYSFDSVSDDNHNLYLPEFLNSIDPGNLPPHKLALKRGCPIILLRNIDPKIRLCNGTRLLCRRFGRNVIEANILVGQFKGHRVFIPRIPLKSAEDYKMSFELTRKQFPIRLSFALTINKSQGQTIGNVGIYLPNHVFGHGQLYVALSRGVSAQCTRILVKNYTVDGHEGVHTKNVVFKEIFARIASMNSSNSL